jgi:hypothetical protein
MTLLVGNWHGDEVGRTTGGHPIRIFMVIDNYPPALCAGSEFMAQLLSGGQYAALRDRINTGWSPDGRVPARPNGKSSVAGAVV